MKTMLPKCYPKTVATLARVAILIVATAILAGCGSKLSGTYKVDANGGIPVEKMNFTSGSKVELTYVGDKVIEASYVVDGDKLKVSAAGMVSIFSIDKDGAINGGETIGRFVKQ